MQRTHGISVATVVGHRARKMIRTIAISLCEDGEYYYLNHMISYTNAPCCMRTVIRVKPSKVPDTRLNTSLFPLHHKAMIPHSALRPIHNRAHKVATKQRARSRLRHLQC